MIDELTPHQKGREIAKFREKFRHEKIHELTKNDFEDFLKACPKLFATRTVKPDARHEDMHGGLVLATFPETKKALEILVDETSRSLHERLEEINSDAVKFKRKKHFKSAIFSPILWLINPEEYAIFNRTVEIMLKQKYHAELDSNEWQTYEKANIKLKEIAKEEGCSLYELDQKTENEFGTKPAKKRSSVFQKLKDRIQVIQDQANYQYVMMRFLLGKKSATRDKITEELKRWNEDKPDNFDFNHTPVFDTNIVKDFTEKVDDTFTLLDHETLNFYERHQLISLCEEKIRGRIDTYNEGTIPYSDLVFSPLTDKQEIKKVHDKVVSTLSGASGKNQSFTINPPTGYFEGEVYWLDKQRIWFHTNTTEKSYWDIFGTEEPPWGKKSIQKWDVEINPPLPKTGEYWGTSGQFLKDNKGGIYYTHAGSIKSKDKKNYRFKDMYAGLALPVLVGNKHRQFIISTIDSPGFVDDVADYAKECHAFRNFVETPEYQALGEEEPTEYWMIRAGGRLEVCPEDCKRNHAKYGEASVVNTGHHIDKVIMPGWDWDNQRTNHFAGIHYYDVDLSKCTESDGTLSEEKVKEKVDKIRRDRGDTELTPKGWGADYGQLQMLFSINRTGSKSRIFVVGKNKDLLGFGDATSQYEYKEGLPNPHAINVEWIDTNKRELPESFGMSGFNRTIKKLSKEEYDLIMAWPLTDFLRRKNNEGVERVTLDVDESSLENAEGKKKTILKHEGQTVQDDIITTARTTRQFWSNTSSYSHHWTDAGYMVKDTPEPPTTVTFVKDDTLQVDSGGGSFQDLIDENEKKKLVEYKTILDQSKGQIIFYGPPGTGKTFIVKKLANMITNAPLDRWLISTHRKIVQFHPSYSYEDFVQGIKPVKIGSELDYQIKPGIFQKLCQPTLKLPNVTWRKAAIYVLNREGGPLHYRTITQRSIDLGINPENSEERATPEFSQLREMTEDIRINGEKSVFKRSVDEKGSEIRGTYDLNETSPNYDSEIQELPEPEIDNSSKVLIIDEINRGNLSKIFGELIYALEYRDEQIDLQYKEFDEGSQFGTLTVPENLFVIGTMNTADRSIILFDAALRRRFSFIPLFPDYNLLAQWFDIAEKFDEDTFREKLANATGETKNKILSILALAKINSALTRDPSIGREKQIGHTFLLELRDSPGNFAKIWKHDIFPLLEEYYFEAPNVITEMFNDDIFESQEGIKNFEEGTLSKALEHYITPIQTVGDETSDSELGND